MSLYRFFQPVLLLTVFLTPLITPNFGFGYEQIKLIFFILGISLSAICGLIFAKSEKNTKTTNIELASIIFLAILTITSILGINFQNSLFGSHPYFQGIILYTYLFLLMLLVSISKIPLISWSILLTFSSILVSFLAIKDFLEINLFHIQIPAYAGRVVSTFGQPNFYAGFILINLPFIYLATKSARPFWKYLIIGISLTSILISYSRSSIIILLFLILAFFWFKLKKDFPKTTVLLSLILTSCLLILIIPSILSFYQNEVVKPATNSWLSSNSPEKRVLIWPVMAQLAQAKPLTGYGLDNIQQSYNQYFQSVDFNRNQNPVYYSLKDVVVSSSHNYLMELILYSGFLGLFSWAFLIFLLLKRVKSLPAGRHGKIILSSLIIYLLWIQFQNQSIAHLMQFWFLTGLINIDTG